VPAAYSLDFNLARPGQHLGLLISSSYLFARKPLVPHVARRPPFQERVERWAQGLPPIRQTILHFRRHLMMDDPPHNPVVLHLAKLLDQHLLRDRWYRPFQIGKSKHVSTEQMEKDHELPSAFQNLERLLDSAGSGDRRVPTLLTVR
jgi:hypothetical protein